MGEQALRVPVSSLPGGLTVLRVLHIQLLAEGDFTAALVGSGPSASGVPRPRGGDLRRRSAPALLGPGAATLAGAGAVADSSRRGGDGRDRLGTIFAELVEFEWTHCDHAAADALLEAALPLCAKLALLHVAGPGAFHHTPAAEALTYGAAYGAEAATLFALPLGSWLPSLFGSGGRLGGGTWLRHVAGLGALTHLHLDLPLTLPAQVRAEGWWTAVLWASAAGLG